MHQVSETPILYFGTPVVLISSINEDGSVNLAPMSSAFWLGWRCIIGLGSASQTSVNLIRTRQCVLNLPSVSQVNIVDRLALTTARNPVPEAKQKKGYQFRRDKFSIAGVTAISSEIISVPRVKECPIHLEAEVIRFSEIGEDQETIRGRLLSFELKIVRVHLDESILMNGSPDKVDPDKWKPLIMSFQQFYGIGEKVYGSRLAQIPENLYKTN